MALDLTGLMTVLGKEIKEINSINSLFATREAGKDAIFAELENESLQDLYITIPPLYEGIYANLSSWIASLITQTNTLLTNEEYVLEELPINQSDITSVLFGIYEYMSENSESFDASTVTINTNDLDFHRNEIAPLGLPVDLEKWQASVFVSRLLDGVNSPANGAVAYHRYINVESQLAENATIHAKVTFTSPGSEVVSIFAHSPLEQFFTADTPSPGNGPSLTNMISNNQLPQNYDFSSWSSDNPVPGWTVTGGSAGTDWEDESGSGAGPLRINTAGTYAKQQISGLIRGQSYCFAAAIQYVGDSGTGTAKFRLENTDGVTVHKDFGTFVSSDVSNPENQFIWLYGFWAPTSLVNLDDIFLVIEHDAEGDSATRLLIYNVFVSPAQYFNGMAWAFVNPYNDISSIISQVAGVSYTELPLGSYTNTPFTIANDDAGVFQAFFRKAYGIQMPTNDSGSETIADTLAT